MFADICQGIVNWVEVPDPYRDKDPKNPKPIFLTVTKAGPKVWNILAEISLKLTFT